MGPLCRRENGTIESIGCRAQEYPGVAPVKTEEQLIRRAEFPVTGPSIGDRDDR